MSAAIASYNTIKLEVNNKIARLTLSRPDKLNALDPEMLAELIDALRLIEIGRASCRERVSVLV